jgi:hypothetical protein
VRTRALVPQIGPWRWRRPRTRPGNHRSCRSSCQAAGPRSGRRPRAVGSAGDHRPCPTRYRPCFARGAPWARGSGTAGRWRRRTVHPRVSRSWACLEPTATETGGRRTLFNEHGSLDHANASCCRANGPPAPPRTALCHPARLLPGENRVPAERHSPWWHSGTCQARGSAERRIRDDQILSTRLGVSAQISHLCAAQQRSPHLSPAPVVRANDALPVVS